MTIQDIFERGVAMATEQNTVHEAAMFMRQAHVGCLVVVNATHHPIGIVTDRDIVLSVVAAGLEPSGIKVTEIMTTPLVSVRENTPVMEVILTMRTHGVRRLPVVNDRNQVVGIIAIDDMMEVLSRELRALVELIDREQIIELNRLN